ncbi:hypothetical protein [Streptosporangium vulgare]|uniref:Uncharacterized protein n=1 Tax=Streptosporangium vulgare TaxID=46190 RepID=A0ABV5TB12_9ACTN
MREFASFNTLRIIVSAIAVLGCLGLAAVVPSVADGATKTTVLASNTPWG